MSSTFERGAYSPRDERDGVIFNAAMTKARFLRKAIRRGDSEKAAKHARDIARWADAVFRHAAVVAAKTGQARAY